MRTGDAFPSQYLKKEDIGDARIAVTIDRVELEEVGQGEDKERKPVIYFAGKEKGMVLNKGNAEAITEAAGGDDEMDNWNGVRVVLYVDRNVTFGGKRVGGLRIAPMPKQRAAPTGAPAAKVQSDTEHFNAAMDELEAAEAQDSDIPF